MYGTVFFLVGSSPTAVSECNIQDARGGGLCTPSENDEVIWESEMYLYYGEVLLILLNLYE